MSDARMLAFVGEQLSAMGRLGGESSAVAADTAGAGAGGSGARNQGKEAIEEQVEVSVHPAAYCTAV